MSVEKSRERISSYLEKFNLSKAAFKRALGKLMKDGLIYQEDGWTYIKND